MGGVMEKGEVDSLRTVDCLRGRLLAERVVSKAAKEEAELISKRLIELERQLAIEIKAKNRAEKRLRHVLRKLETLKISSHSNVSESSESSSSSCLRNLQLQGEQKPNSQTKKSTLCDAEEEKMEEAQDLGDETSDRFSNSSVDQSVSQEESWGSVETAQSHNNPVPGPEVMVESKDDLDSGKLRTDAIRESSICSKEIGAEQQSESVNDTIGLVPATMWPKSDVARGDVQSVLVSLRHVKEHVQNSTGRRDVVC